MFMFYVLRFSFFVCVLLVDPCNVYITCFNIHCNVKTKNKKLLYFAGTYDTD